MMNYQIYIRPLLFAGVDYLSVLISLYLAMEITLHYGNPNISYHLSKSYIFMWIPAIFLMFNR